ncbi:MAG: carotenoid oxygenase family protein [Prochloraceae cyanobacterium]
MSTSFFSTKITQGSLPENLSGYVFTVAGNETTTIFKAHKAIVNLDGRAIVAGNIGRYWEIDPLSLETINPVGYFDEQVISLPIPWFPVVANTARPFYDRITKELISCQLKASPYIDRYRTSFQSDPYIIKWDGKSELKKWKLEGTILDGSPQVTIATEKFIAIPDIPWQVGLPTLLGLKTSPTANPTTDTDIYIVDRSSLTQDKASVPSRRLTLSGTSHDFLCNYYPVDNKITLIAIQQATTSYSETIQENDVKEINGESYPSSYWGKPWLFGFHPGVLRKVIISDAKKIEEEEVFIHPGWFSATVHTADPREKFTKSGYFAIYQGYLGYDREFICRRQYQSFRNDSNRIISADKQLPEYNLPSVLAKIPLNINWNKFSQKIQIELKQNPSTPLSELGKQLLDFYVFPDGYLLNTIQFIPEDSGYIFAIVSTNKHSEAWIFDANSLSKGTIAVIHLSRKIPIGLTSYCEYFAELKSSPHNYKIDRFHSLPLSPPETDTLELRIV